MTELTPLELIHAEIDGELDAQQRAALARELLAQPHCRALREDLKHVCAALDSTVAVEPPPQLRANILQALPAIVRPAPVRRTTGGFAPAAGWRYAALFAGVLATGALLYQTRLGRAPDANEAAGTMTDAGARTPVLLDSVRLELAQVTGQVSLQRRTAGLALELQLNASAPVDLLVASGGQSLRISGLGRPDSPGGPRTSVALPEFGAGQTLELTFLIAGRQIGTAQLKVPANR